MSAPLDDQYLTWLYSRIGSVNVTNPVRTYWKLFRQLYTKEFVWIVPNDDNRVEDGKDLRLRFLEESGVGNVDPGWMGLGCSMLEMIMGVAERASFEDDAPARVWFWHLLTNLGLDKYTDNHADATKEINEVCDQVIWRTYSPEGDGGLFPLREPDQDQRGIEIWYQMSSYLLERS
jgi:hypothetical protein